MPHEFREKESEANRLSIQRAVLQHTSLKGREQNQWASIGM